MSKVFMAQRPAHTGIVPKGYEVLGSQRRLSMLQSPCCWWIVSAYHQRCGVFGLLVYDERQTRIVFLSTPKEIDAFCALLEWCICFALLLASDDQALLEWRTIWWMAQTTLAQQRLRKEVGA